MTETIDETTAQLSAEEIKQAVEVLARLQPGFLPREIFEQTTRLYTPPIVELVPVRKLGDHTEVLLFKRPADDPNWPLKLHTPGTVVRPTDVGHDLDIPLARLYKDELQFQPSTVPKFVGTKLHRVARGSELATILFIDLSKADTPAGNWYPANNLPEDLVSTQREFITEAVQAFEGGST